MKEKEAVNLNEDERIGPWDSLEGGKKEMM